jgi:glyoxylase-like metal-dependent hydrolase (beta-lactamase superfamily II)
MDYADPPLHLDLGGLTVTLIRAGRLRLDGGAMFGVVPKAIWARASPPDERNRIDLACNSLLVEWPGSARRLIVEAGHGPKYEAKEQDIFAIDPEIWLLPRLRAAGVEADTITDVVLTHLHFDHAGGLTHAVDGRLAPALPNARICVQRREHDDARANFGVMTATYRAENFTPLDDAHRWQLLDGEADLAPGVRVLPTPGHTRGHQAVVLTGRERTLVYGGDVLPTRAHVGAAYNMAYDLFPLENRATKQRLLAWAAERGALCAIDHEIAAPLVAVRRHKEWFELVDAAP